MAMATATATAAPLWMSQGLNLESGSFQSGYRRCVFLNNEFLRSRPELFRRHLLLQHQHWKLSITKASTTHKLMSNEQNASVTKNDIEIVTIHHVGLLCENLEKSLEFYQGLLGLTINNARPDDRLPYRGAWLWVGSEMIHLMELPNPDPLTGRPEHGGRDRHTCIAIKNVNQLKSIFDEAGITYTLSRSGRPAIFARDPDGNALEFIQVD